MGLMQIFCTFFWQFLAWLLFEKLGRFFSNHLEWLQQVDGSILACCATGTSTRDTLLSWIRFLQRENPGTNLINVFFLFVIEK